MGYTYSESNKTLVVGEPLATTDDLILICNEVDEDTPVEELEAHISAAHIMLMNRLDGYGLPVDLLELIEKYLAAHFAVLTNPAVQRETLGPLSTTYFGKAELGLDHTRYGQMAKSLDPTGRLDPENKNRVVLKSIGGVR